MKTLTKLPLFINLILVGFENNLYNYRHYMIINVIYFTYFFLLYYILYIFI